MVRRMTDIGKCIFSNLQLIINLLMLFMLSTELAQEIAALRSGLVRDRSYLWRIWVSLREADAAIEDSLGVHCEAIELIERLRRSAPLFPLIGGLSGAACGRPLQSYSLPRETKSLSA
jgi:hypothetical protein